MKSRLFVAFVLCQALGIAQPFIHYRGARNAASLLPPGHPGASIARGSIFTLSGRNLGPSASVEPLAFPLPGELSGVTVEIAQGSLSMQAVPVFVSVSASKCGRLWPRTRRSARCRCGSG